MLESAARPSLLAFGILGFAPDEHLSGTQPNRWSAVMSVTKRTDVKKHMRPPFLPKIHLIQPESQPDATGFSGIEPDATKAGVSAFAGDFVVEHTSAGTAVAQTRPITVTTRPLAAPVPKRGQA